MTTASDLPPARAPMIGNDGLATTVYYRFFASLWRRTGGAVDTIGEDTERIDALEAEIAVMRSQHRAQISRLEARIAALETDMDMRG